MKTTTPSIPLTWKLSNSQFVKPSADFVQIANNPLLLSSSEAVINYIFSNKKIYPEPNKTILKLNVFGSVSTGGYIKLKNGFTSVSIKPSDTPSVGEFYRNFGLIGANDRSIIAESIVYELKNNLTFNSYYNIYAQGATVFIESHFLGSEYNFDIAELTSGLVLLGGVSQINQNSSNTYTFQNLIDFSTFVEVYVANGVYGENINKNNSILVDTFDIIQTKQDNFAINVGQSVKNFVDIVLPTKKQNSNIVVKELDKQPNLLPICRPFYIVWGYSNRFASGLDKKKFVTGVSQIRFVFNSAFPFLEAYNFNDYILDTTSTFPFKFMTNCPRFKETDYNSHEYLHFYRKFNTFELGQFGLEVDYTFLDASTATKSYDIGNYAGITGVCSIDVSPDVLNLQNVESVYGKKIDNYTIKLYWTIDDTTRYYSEGFTYSVKRMCEPEENNIIFLNDFGVWDTINFTGYKTVSVDREFNYYNRSLAITTPNYGFTTESDELSIPINANVSTKTRLTTNIVDESYYKYVKELLKSTAIFIYDKLSYRYKAIKIEQFDFDFTKFKKLENILAITYSETIEENTISR